MYLNAKISAGTSNRTGVEKLSWAAVGRDSRDEEASSHSFQWLQRAQRTEESAQDDSLSTSEIADAWRYAGHCRFQAAYQSGDDTEFRERMRQASSDFQNAAAILMKQNDRSAAVLAKRFSALSYYCDAQSARDTSIVLDCLHRSQEALVSAWGKRHSVPEILSSGLPIELLRVTEDLMHYESQEDHRLPILRTALELNESADSLLSGLGKDLAILLMTEIIELNMFAWTNLPEYQEREEAGLLSQKLFERLRTLVQTARDPRAIIASYGLQFWGDDLGVLPFERPITDPGRLLSLIQKTRDRLAIGILFACNLNNAAISLYFAEDPVYAKQLLENGETEATNALTELRAFGGIRRFQYSPGDLICTHGRELGERALLTCRGGPSYRLR